MTGEVTFDDLVKGPITVANAELDDLVLMRADGVPTYNFGVVVDDIDMDITHVIRGDDHVNNTPRQINIYKALGAELPQFAHVPMILGADGERLSKRHGAVSVMQYRDEGYLPEALRQLPRAPRLVARRRGEVLARAARRVVRPRGTSAGRRRASTPRSWRGSTRNTSRKRPTRGWRELAPPFLAADGCDVETRAAAARRSSRCSRSARAR